MKKHLFFSVLSALLMISSVALASTKVGTPKVWTVPAIFTADQEVTFYYDMTDVGFPEGVDLYLWAWQPTEPDAGNGNNSSDFAKLTYLGDNLYCKTMIPTEYFHSDKSAFESDDWPGFWQQLKTKTDDLWSTEFAAPDNRMELKDFKESGAGIKFYSGSNHNYTEKFNLTQPLSVLFNGDVYKLGDRTLNEITKDANFVQFGTHSGLAGTYNGEDMDWNPMQGLDVWRPLTLKKTGLKNLGNGLWKWDIETPATYYSYQWGDGNDPLTTPKTPTLFGEHPDAVVDYQCDALKYLVVTVIVDDKGDNQWGANSGDQVQKAGTAEVYPDPQFSFFPQKFCALDILTLTRRYNGKTDGDLTYEITAGGKTLTGTMTGNRDKREAVVNLLKELAGVSGPAKIHLKITNSKDATVAETDLPLVPLSEITYE